VVNEWMSSNVSYYVNVDRYRMVAHNAEYASTRRYTRTHLVSFVKCALSLKQ